MLATLASLPSLPESTCIARSSLEGGKVRPAFLLVDPIEDRVSYIATATFQKDDSIRPIIPFIYWRAPEWTTMQG
jgi:hypothetical protein